MVWNCLHWIEKSLLLRLIVLDWLCSSSIQTLPKVVFWNNNWCMNNFFLKKLKDTKENTWRINTFRHYDILAAQKINILFASMLRRISEIVLENLFSNIRVCYEDISSAKMFANSSVSGVKDEMNTVPVMSNAISWTSSLCNWMLDSYTNWVGQVVQRGGRTSQNESKQHSEVIAAKELISSYRTALHSY